MKLLPVNNAPKKLAQLVAKTGFKPHPWQTQAPLDLYASNLPPVEDSEEFQRVVALPTRPRIQPHTPEAEALIYMARERFGRTVPSCDCRTRHRDCIHDVRAVQAWALYELGLQSGLLGAIGVGHGKTILDLLAPLAIPDCKTAVLLVPPGLVTQLISEYELIRNHWRVPSLISHAGQTYAARVSGAPTLHIFPYSRLSRPDASTWFTNMRPDFVIADECHKLRNPQTATTSRVLRYFDRNPQTRFAGWTGSLTDSKIEDYAHLAALALRTGSPLPLVQAHVWEWSQALSAGTVKGGSEPRPPGALLQLCEPGEHVRDGFRTRLASTPGICTTHEASVDVNMVIDVRSPGPVPESIAELLHNLRVTWTRPDGEELTDALSVARCARELACGMFYRWTFPRGEPIHVITEWLAIRKEWNKAVRTRLFDRIEQLDSPHLCQLAAMRAWGDMPPHKDRPVWRTPIWPEWKRIKDAVKPETEPVRVSDFLVNDAAAWAHQHRGVVWYEIDDFGSWLAKVAGLPKHGGGPHAPAELAKERGDRSIIASIKAHGTGRDGLQRIFHHQLVAQPPSSAAMWEQLLGRLHRQGQAHEVHTWFYAHTPDLRAYVAQAIRRASYVQETLGSLQKIKVYNMPWLSERTPDHEDLIEPPAAAVTPGQRCTNGCDAPIHPPSKVLCGACFDVLDQKMHKLLGSMSEPRGN